MIAATILTHNLFRNERHDLFLRTLDSLSVPGVTVVPVDNGSTDGTAEYVEKLGGFCYRGANNTCGRGTNICARVATGLGADLCVLSDDDMEWSEDWAFWLERFWAQAPDDVILAGCHLEPEFPWNQIEERIAVNGIGALIRKSTGAASWSFRTEDWPKIGPIPDRVQGHGDVPACDAIWASGYRIAQLDLAEHLGQGRSSWGNQTERLYGWDLESIRARLEES